MLLKVTLFNNPPVSNSAPRPGIKSILLNKPPGAYSIIYGNKNKIRTVKVEISSNLNFNIIFRHYDFYMAPYHQGGYYKEV